MNQYNTSIVFLFFFSFIFISCKGTQTDIGGIKKTEHIMGEITNSTTGQYTNMNNLFNIAINRKQTDTHYMWEVIFIQGENKRIIEKEAVNKEAQSENPNFRLSYHPQFYNSVQILVIKHDKKNKELFLLIDQFGEVFLYQYTFDGKTINDIKRKKKIKITTYDIVPMDMDLMLARAAKIQISQKKLLVSIAATKNTFHRVSLNTEIVKQFNFDIYAKDNSEIKDPDSHEFISSGDITDEKTVLKVIESLLEKLNLKDVSWAYDICSETPDSAYSYEKDGKRNGLVYFFTTINGNKKVLIYDTSAAKEWTITDYQELSEGESEDNTWK